MRSQTSRRRHTEADSKLSSRIGRKRLYNSSAERAQPAEQNSWAKTTSTETVEEAHRASTRITNPCTCAPPVRVNLRPAHPSRLAPRTFRTPPHQHAARFLRIMCPAHLSRVRTSCGSAPYAPRAPRRRARHMPCTACRAPARIKHHTPATAPQARASHARVARQAPHVPR